jgi:hypothetical protein
MTPRKHKPFDLYAAMQPPRPSRGAKKAPPGPQEPPPPSLINNIDNPLPIDPLYILDKRDDNSSIGSRDHKLRDQLSTQELKFLEIYLGGSVTQPEARLSMRIGIARLKRQSARIGLNSGLGGG